MDKKTVARTFLVLSAGLKLGFTVQYIYARSLPLNPTTFEMCWNIFVPKDIQRLMTPSDMRALDTMVHGNFTFVTHGMQDLVDVYDCVHATDYP